jgi:hypothetical protein
VILLLGAMMVSALKSFGSHFQFSEGHQNARKKQNYKKHMQINALT